MSEYFSNPNLLSAPVLRSAFSDRTAYVMAEMSRLAYFRFEGGRNIQEIVKELAPIVDDHRKLKSIASVLTSEVSALSADESRSILAEVLSDKGFTLRNTFSKSESGVQAFLCTRVDSTMAVLAFRGTELSIKDIKADVKANLVDVDHPIAGRGQVRMHSGYWTQFVSIREELASALKEPYMANRQLFITGHSLGGALAITATKFLSNDSTGACYTFGSPPVGTVQFDWDIRTPIYRIINHVDIVPQLPNPTLAYLIRGMVFLAEFIVGLFSQIVIPFRKSGWYAKFNQVMKDARQYRQSGYGSYLIGESSKVRLRYNVGSFDKITWWIRQVQNLFKAEFKLLSDHSIEKYSEKLSLWAENRQS